MAFKSPAEIAKASVAIGKAKTELPWNKLLILGFLAGAYIAFGGHLAVMVTAGMPEEVWGTLKKFVFGGVFPVGLMLVVIAGSELFTGNCLLPTIACLKGEGKWLGLLKNWVLVYISNFIGSLFVAYFLSYATGFYTAEPWMSTIGKIGAAKCSLTFGQAFWRGVGCNWLVCLAVWLAIASDDVISKIWGIWFPIMAFVAIGFEHSVANMFFVPAAIFATGKAAWGIFLVRNLLPVTLGNIVGGALFVACIYWYLYLREA